ncbi:hypothetical protein FRX31_024144 [Thalictrum thalictroides]|uniref:Uncharacterized protein n=1 Tax=Thalictrum thalictroides TaxID=46969 RepID=A0A7J6VNC9_THATH|nr:hypothetical protein FRX31_024144 [Thalictrum thalictroides]
MVLSNRIKSDKYTTILLDPKLPQHSNCVVQLLNINEEAPLHYCHLCLEGRLSSELFPCHDHGRRQVCLNAINPKSPSGITTSTTGGGFMKEDITYMVTDKLNVHKLSPVQAIAHLHNSNVSVDDVEEQVVLLGEVEGLKILQSSLISKSTTVLTDVFARKQD